MATIMEVTTTEDMVTTMEATITEVMVMVAMADMEVADTVIIMADTTVTVMAIIITVMVACRSTSPASDMCSSAGKRHLAATQLSVPRL
ncbi:hypothetical protein [Roseimicrobium gellanilyticum]|nr:hypothetical protein [Roseimicrobium gellanilyticum]